MKKTISLTVTLFSFLLSSFSQAGPFEFSPQMDSIGFKGKSYSWLTHVNTNKNQTNALITFADRDRVFYYLVDSNFKIRDQYAAIKDEMVANYYGSRYEMILQTSNGNIFRNYIRKQNGSEIFIEVPDFNNHFSDIKSFIDYSSKEKFLTAFEDNNHIYFLTLRKNTHTIRVYTDSAGQQKDIDLVIKDSLPGLNFNLEESLKDLKIIKNTREPDLYTCKSADKLYIQGNGEVILTLDNNFQFTLIFKINLNNYTSESKIIRKNFSYCNSNENANAVQTNSFVYGDKILQGVFCRNDLLLQLKNINTESLIKEWYASRDSAITFSSSSLIKREEGKQTVQGPLWLTKKETLKDKSEKDLKTKDFFKAVNKSTLSFLIVPHDPYLLIKIGEAHDLQTGGGGGAPMYMGGGSVSTPGGTVSLPGYWTSGGAGYASKSGKIETYFKTVLQKENLEFVPSTDLYTSYDNVDELEDQLKDSADAEYAFDFNNKTYLFYWLKKSKKFMIELIK